jgi:hypothetical protein
MERTLTALDWTNVQIDHSSSRKHFLPDHVAELQRKFGKVWERVEWAGSLVKDLSALAW